MSLSESKNCNSLRVHGTRMYSLQNVTVLFLIAFLQCLVPNTADAQRVWQPINGDWQILTEELSDTRFGQGSVEWSSPEDFYGQDAEAMIRAIEAGRQIKRKVEFEWTKKLTEGGNNSCVEAADGLVLEVENIGLPKGYKIRNVGTLGFLTNRENNFFDTPKIFVSGFVAPFSDAAPYTYDPLNPPVYAHTFNVVQTPDGKYYSIDIWAGPIKTRRVYPIGSKAEFFSYSPTETDVENAAFRLFEPSDRGRGWTETIKQYNDRKALEPGNDIVVCRPPVVGRKIKVVVVASKDPNDKIGLAGVGDARFISPDQELDYKIRFENTAEATAPAEEVLVRDTLDTTVFDLSTLQLGDLTFGSRRVEVPRGRSNFTTRVTLDDPFEVLIDAYLELETGVLTWRFITLDTNTGAPPVNPFDGFLPPNATSPEGEGSVSFSIRLVDGIADNSVIENQAGIYFDLNERIDTPAWINTVDLTAPNSSITGLESVQPDSTFVVAWGGSDAGAGIDSYDVYYAVNGGEFSPWILRTSTTEDLFSGADDATYSFFSVAYDAAGNIETMKTIADATTAVQVGLDDDNDDAGRPTDYELATAYPNPNDGVSIIRYGLPLAGSVSLVVYNMQGREVARLVDIETQSAGWHEAAVDVKHWASGVYMYRLIAGGEHRVAKMTVVR